MFSVLHSFVAAGPSTLQCSIFGICLYVARLVQQRYTTYGRSRSTDHVLSLVSGDFRIGPGAQAPSCQLAPSHFRGDIQLFFVFTVLNCQTKYIMLYCDICEQSRPIFS